MHTAPRDGTDIQVRLNGVWWVASYWDCDWLNDGTTDGPINDCWAIRDAQGPGSIELFEAEGCEYATAILGDYRIDVQDLDGDFSEWTVKDQTGQVIANGGAAIGNHFEACKAAAWATIHSLESVPTGYMMTFGLSTDNTTERE